MVAGSTKGRLQTIGRRSVFVLRLATGILLIFMMMLTVVDVVLRYGFNSSIRGGFEITELTVAALMFAGFPLVSLRAQHITIDLFDRAFPPRMRRALDCLAQLVCTGVFIGIALLLFRKADRMTLSSDVTSAINIPILPIVWVLIVFSVATALVHLWKAVAFAIGSDAGLSAAASSSEPPQGAL
jgi:TRAP-type C4-dicarboxylate transport system permease small subunit